MTSKLTITNAIKIFYIMLTSTLLLIGCKDDYKACFTVDKAIANVGDTITFSNCSEYNGNTIDAFWDFGDKSSAYSKGNESVKHSFKNAGQYIVELWVGQVEHGSKKEMSITIQ
jgi:PKD repeat protein